MPNEPIINFNSGELSPLVDARSDIEKYNAGCRIVENMLPLVYGVAERRPGTEYIYGCIDSDVGSRLIPFIYSNSIAYIVEMGDLLFRYFYDGGIVLDSSSNIVTTTTPYLAADLFEIQFIQSIDVMYLFHRDYAPRQLTRVSASQFDLDEIEFKDGPFLPRNDYYYDNDVELNCSVTAVGAQGTLTARGPFSPIELFESDHVGSLWKLTHPRTYTSAGGPITTSGVLGSEIPVDGPFTFTTSGHWDATIELQRNEDSKGWETYRTWTSAMTGGAGSLNAHYTGIEYVENVQYRINVTSYTTSSAGASAYLTVNTSTRSGIVKITSVTSSTVANCTVIYRLSQISTTKEWHEGAWSGVRGYPKTACIFQDRMVYASTTWEPQTLWFSESGAYRVVK